MLIGTATTTGKAVRYRQRLRSVRSMPARLMPGSALIINGAPPSERHLGGLSG
jgi:hypothetical protein